MTRSRHDVAFQLFGREVAGRQGAVDRVHRRSASTSARPTSLSTMTPGMLSVVSVGVPPMTVFGRVVGVHQYRRSAGGNAFSTLVVNAHAPRAIRAIPSIVLVERIASLDRVGCRQVIGNVTTVCQRLRNRAFQCGVVAGNRCRRRVDRCSQARSPYRSASMRQPWLPRAHQPASCRSPGRCCPPERATNTPAAVASRNARSCGSSNAAQCQPRS